MSWEPAYDTPGTHMVAGFAFAAWAFVDGREDTGADGRRASRGRSASAIVEDIPWEGRRPGS